MPLVAGARLGPYEISGLLGAGGMGEVYKARDTRLDRTVAIKVLPADISADGDRRARLEREAKTVAALSHPHICTVYEVNESDGRTFIVMEYLEGRPLAETVPHDGLPPATVIRYGMQVADALAHAHERGIIHRDLKTANIVVNAQGMPKVLDFGLAVRVQPRRADATTVSAGAVDADHTAGTLAYLPPEALLGQPTDARGDIWSLGVVLHEIATGRLPFAGRNSFELTAAILRAAPDVFPAHVPVALRTVIARCLAKEPVERYQHAGEVRAALEAIGSGVPTVPIAMSRWKRRVVPAAALTLAAAGGITGWVLMTGSEPDWKRFAAEARLRRISASDDRTFSPALSPDGRMFCYVQQTSEGHTDLYVGRMSGGTRIRLTHDDAVEDTPRFSPDGELVAFTRYEGAKTNGAVQIVPALGGDIVSTIPRASDPAWSPDGQRLAFLREFDGGELALVVSALDGTGASVILEADSVYPRLRSPAWSPDARHVAVVRGTGGAAGEIWLVPVDGGRARRILDEPASTYSESPVFTSDGRGLVHSSNRGGSTNLWVLPLPDGAPVRLTTGPGPDEWPSVASDGSITFLNSRWRDVLQVWDLDSSTSRTILTHTPYLWGPAVSPDGKDVAIARSEVDGTWHIWLLPLEGGTPRRLTWSEHGELYPQWSRDGAFVLFHSWNTPRRFGRVPRAGGPVEWLPFGGHAHDGFADLSHDGRNVAFVRADADGEHVYISAIEGGGERVLTRTSGSVPRWSPDGRRIAFSGGRSVTGGIFVINADGTAERRLTIDGGWPVWWPDGKQLGYLSLDSHGNQQLRVVPVNGGASRPLTQIKLTGINHPFAITPNGRTIVVADSEHVSDEIWLLDRRKRTEEGALGK